MLLVRSSNILLNFLSWRIEMAVKLCMEGGVTLVKAVAVVITGYNAESKMASVTINESMTTSMKVVEGADEVENLIGKKASLTIDGVVLEKVAPPVSSTSNRAGSAKKIDMSIL